MQEAVKKFPIYGKFQHPRDLPTLHTVHAIEVDENGNAVMLIHHNQPFPITECTPIKVVNLYDLKCCSEQKIHKPKPEVNVKKSFKQIRSIILKLKEDQSKLNSQSRIVIEQIESILVWYKNKIGE